MFRRMLFGAAAVLASAGIVQAAAKDDLQAAVQKLADTSYSWTTTNANATPAGGGNGGGAGRGGAVAPVNGKSDKDLSMVTMTMMQNDYVELFQGTKAVVKTADGWKTVAEITADAANGGGANPGDAFVARQAATFKTPTADALAIVSKLTDVQKADDVYTSTLSADDAKALITARGAGGGRRGGANAAPPAITDPKVTVKVTVKDGVASKFEIHMTGTISINGNDRPVDRTITTDIKDVGSTKIDVPAEAKTKLDSIPTTKP